MPRSVPQVAQCEDYDSDQSSAKPGTRKEARRKTTTSGPPKTLNRYRNGHRDGASDSGYSSHTSGTQASNASANGQAPGLMPPPPRPATAQGQTKSKPVIHRSESHRSRPAAPSRSQSTSKQSVSQCDDPNCGHPTCLSLRPPARRYTTSQQYPSQYAQQYTTSSAPYEQQMPQYQYQYAQVSQSPTTQTVPTLVAQPRSRAGSTSRQARPASIHAYSYQGPYSGAQQGPPPANSAYQNLAVAWAQYYQQQQAYQAAYGTTPPNQTVPVYPQASPTTASPTSPNYPTSSGLQRTYSARSGYPAAANDTSRMQHQPTLTRTTSARQPSARTSAMPGAFPGGDPESSETDSDSDSSESDMSPEEYERERRARARDSRLMSSSSSSQRRPSIKRQFATAPLVPTRSSRDMLRRNPRPDNVLDYISSSDNVDSDRTARAVVNKPRTTYTDSSRNSRRPSISTTASSGRTKSTMMSSVESGVASLVLEGKNGRHISYLSKRDQEALHRQYARQQLEEEQRRRDAIEAYQEAVRGPSGPELTAENIRMQQLRGAGSRMSAPSHKSSRSLSKVPNGEGITIESGGTVIHVYGGSKIEMRPGEDGAPAQFVIGSVSGKDSAYHGSSSKSSSSRVGRSHGNSDVGSRRRDTIREEDGLEQPTN